MSYPLRMTQAQGLKAESTKLRQLLTLGLVGVLDGFRGRVSPTMWQS